MIDTSTMRVLDVHAHPFVNRGEQTAEEFTDTISFGGGSPAYMEQGGVTVDDAVLEELRRNKHDVVYFRYTVRALADLFDCAPQLDAVIEARNAAIRAGYTAYTAQLYNACNLDTMVVDFGYPQPPIAVEQFDQEMPETLEIVPIYRIEPLIVDLLSEGVGWDEFSRRYDESIAHALEYEGFKGVKSIIAYRTGLDISPLSRTPDQGRLALDAIRRGIGGDATKKLRDHLLCRAMELCMDYDVPMQIHTGMGDYEVNLTECRPALLMDLLRFPTFRACRVLLVHTGYPYHAEAGYMANVLPRVYCDLSEGIPFAGGAARRIVSEVLEMAPLSKVVYGSDGYGAPEINYVGAVLGKQAVGQALQVLVNDGMFSHEEATTAAGAILSGNARRLYQLDK